MGIPTASAMENCQNTYYTDVPHKYIWFSVENGEKISSLDIFYRNTPDHKNFVTYNARIEAKNNSQIIFTRSASDENKAKHLYSDIFIKTKNIQTEYVSMREKEMKNCQNLYSHAEELYAGGENVITWKSYDDIWSDDSRGIDFVMPANINGSVMISFNKKYPEKHLFYQEVQYFIPQFRIHTKTDSLVVKTFDISEKNIDTYLANDTTVAWCYGDICTIKISSKDIKNIVSVSISEMEFPYSVMKNEVWIKNIQDPHNWEARIFPKK